MSTKAQTPRSAIDGHLARSVLAMERIKAALRKLRAKQHDNDWPAAGSASKVSRDLAEIAEWLDGHP